MRAGSPRSQEAHGPWEAVIPGGPRSLEGGGPGNRVPPIRALCVVRLVIVFANSPIVQYRPDAGRTSDLPVDVAGTIEGCNRQGSLEVHSGNILICAIRSKDIAPNLMGEGLSGPGAKFRSLASLVSSPGFGDLRHQILRRGCVSRSERQDHRWMARSSTARAASWMPSARVGWACMVRARSSALARNSMAVTASAMSSEACAPST